MKDFIKANKLKILIGLVVVVYALFLWARQIQYDFVPIKYDYDTEKTELTFVAARGVTLEDCEIVAKEGTVLFPVEGKPFTVRIALDSKGDGKVCVSYRDWRDRPRYGVITIMSYTPLPGIVYIEQQDEIGRIIESEQVS